MDSGHPIASTNEGLRFLLNRYTVQPMSDSEKIPKIRLSKKQIREGLKAVPIERILLGAAEMGGRQLTAKQVAFAEALAMGETKAGAYRKVYKSKGKPQTASRRGQELAKNGAIAAHVEAKKAEKEGEKSQTPAQIREMTIRALVRHAQDEDFPPAQRVKALELLGKITEVALFTERREVVKVTDSGEIRERLLASIREAMKEDAIEVEAREADALMAEISEPNPINAGESEPVFSDGMDTEPDATQGEDPKLDAEPGKSPTPAEIAAPAGDAHPTPQDSKIEGSATTHSIPDIQSASQALPDSTCPPVQVDFPLEIKEIDPKCSLT